MLENKSLKNDLMKLTTQTDETNINLEKGISRSFLLIETNKNDMRTKNKNGKIKKKLDCWLQQYRLVYFVFDIRTTLL